MGLPTWIWTCGVILLGARGALPCYSLSLTNVVLLCVSSVSIDAGDVLTNVPRRINVEGFGTHKPHVTPAGSVIVDCASVSCLLSSSVPAPAE